MSARRKLAPADRGKRAEAEEHENREPRRRANCLEAEDESMERRVQGADTIRAKRQHEAEQSNRRHRQHSRATVASPPEPCACDREREQHESRKQLAFRACVRRSCRCRAVALPKEIGAAVHDIARGDLQVTGHVRRVAACLVQVASETFALPHAPVHDRHGRDEQRADRPRGDETAQEHAAAPPPDANGERDAAPRECEAADDAVVHRR